MYQTIKYITGALAGCMAMAACSKGPENTPSGSDGTKPLAITTVQVENQAGKAKLSYEVPADKRLLYVKAVYNMSNGQEATVKASYYESSLIVEGFADTLEHEVKLYTVSRNEIPSDPLIVKVKPLEASIWRVYRSINVVNAFGGFNLSASNPAADNISLIVLTKNIFKEFEVNNTYSIYTNVIDILRKARGLDTTARTIGFLVKDRWGNKTDTLYKVVTPIYETELAPQKFQAFVLPGDAPQVTNGARLEYAWDGRTGWPYTSFTHQVNGGPQPHMITFDMGVQAKLSRVWIRPFPEGTRYYFLTTMKRFEIYGATNPTMTGELDASWRLLGSYEVVKPSGLAYGTDNTLDQETAAAGFNWEIDLSAPKVRYMRIRCLENFAGGTAQSINEIKVYGDNR